MVFRLAAEGLVVNQQSHAMNKVSEKILADARKEAADVEEKARREERDLLKAKEKALAQATAKHEERLAAIYRAELKRQEALAEFEFRKSILMRKRELMGEIFRDVAEHLLRPEIYLNFLEAMILRGAVSGEEVIIVSERDRNLLDDTFLKGVNKKAGKRLGHTTNLRLDSEVRETGGGLFLREDKIEFNASIDTVMRNVSEDMEMELSRFLFSEGEE